MLGLSYLFSAQLLKAVTTIVARNIHLFYDHDEWPYLLKRPIHDLSVPELQDLLYQLTYFELHGAFPPQ